MPLRAASPAPEVSANPSPPAGPATIQETIRELHHWLAAPPVPEPPERLPAMQPSPAEARPIAQAVATPPAPARPAVRQGTPDPVEDMVRISIGTVQVRLDPPALPPRRDPPRPAAPFAPAPPRLARFYLR